MAWISIDDLKCAASEASREIVIRSYDQDGNSSDTRRAASKLESEIINKLLFGGLFSYHQQAYIGLSDDEYRLIANAIAVTIESSLDAFINDCNGYDTIFRPFKEIIRRLYGINTL